MNSGKKKILFVHELWCDNDPSFMQTNSIHNLDNTFIKAKPEYEFHRLYFDEAKMIYNRHIDEILPQYCKVFGISVIVFSLQGGHNQNPNFLLHGAEYNPSIKCLKQLKEMGIYTVIMWPDTGSGWGMTTIQQLGDIPDLHVSWDNPTSPFHDNLIYKDNHLFLWCPQDENLYYETPYKGKSIECSFLGSNRYPDRKFFLHHLLKEFPNLTARGGQREEKLSCEKYAELMRNSKICINFSFHPAGFYQTKGRIFETLACGGLLFESENPSTRKILTPSEHYIEFSDVNDLSDKIRYYSENQNEAERIANNGREKYLSNFHPQIFWDKVLENA